MRNKHSKAYVLNTAKNLFLIVMGTLVLAFGTAIFILPFDLVVGGISGMAIIIDSILPFDFIGIDLIITILTWSLFFMGLLFLGKAFAMKTLISTVIYPIALSLFLRLADPEVLGGFFCLGASRHIELSLFIAAAAGGVFVGTGCAITFHGGGSTGGVDIIALTVCKFFRRLKSSVVIFAIDALTVLLGMFIIGDLVLTLLGILSAFLSAVVVDKLFLGISKAFIAHIITDKNEEINREIIEKLGRTSTILSATGGYSGNDKKILMVSFTMSQYATLMNIINRIDNKAFITIHPAYEINGEGWTK
ncbi:MAG: YitT family protein [Clostridia bacterium]|nr:YitT family protein [Clostridia bacterium]